MATTLTTDQVIGNPIQFFLEEQRYHGKTERTLQAYERVLSDFTVFVKETTPNEAIDTVERRTCMEWVHSLRAEKASSTVATYASYVNRFFRYMVEVGEFSANPMSLVIEQMPESIEADPVRRDIALPDMRVFVAECRHPLTKALVITLLKTGMRVGELCNLDIRDISCEWPLSKDYPPYRAALEGRQEAIYVDSSISLGDEVNGETRTASNKRQRTTIIPMDEELIYVLTQWLAIRPDVHSPAEPLFVDTGDSWGERLTPEDVRYRLRCKTTPFGWHQSGADASENVTPHYFRHFFTTYLRDRTGDRGIVKYLRGDVADDVIDTYTHNWGDRVEERYRENIYSLL